MGKSARVLGKGFGLTANEMNFVLKEEGYLDGEPGNYTVTEKGKKYAVEQDYHRGTGGYAQYNAHWTTRVWDDEIADEFDITDDRKEEIRQAIHIAKQKTEESDNEDIFVNYSDYDNKNLNIEEADDDALVIAVIAILTAVSAYGIYKAVPYIKRWWMDKAVPNLKSIKNKIIGKTERPAEETDRESLDLNED